MDNITENLIRHEGLRLKPYRCTSGKLTIGVGRNLDDNGITEEEAMYLLSHDIAIAKDIARRVFTDFDKLSDNRQRALVNMAFNLGETKLRGFVNFIRAINDYDFNRAADCALASRWAKQVGKRSTEVIRWIKEG
jgi:lysozyme